MENNQDFRERVLESFDQIRGSLRDLNHDMKEIRTEMKEIRTEFSDMRVSQARVEQQLSDRRSLQGERWRNVGIITAIVGVIIFLVKSFFF